MDASQSAEITCPYCGQEIEVAVDCSVHRQTYIEDCAVCCRPITITLVATGGEVQSIEARSEDE
ncbi:MAG: CPXCG motif-containing cysteine-rich protein [Krumholzibacteria bacterium]|nr:CPXCG motif-containing cysteine-rich protein [Candidatus Krumholzibacteria bacterium]